MERVACAGVCVCSMNTLHTFNSGIDFIWFNNTKSTHKYIVVPDRTACSRSKYAIACYRRFRPYGDDQCLSVSVCESSTYATSSAAAIKKNKHQFELAIARQRITLIFMSPTRAAEIFFFLENIKINPIFHFPNVITRF